MPKRTPIASSSHLWQIECYLLERSIDRKKPCRKRSFTLRWEEMRPAIRLAHRLHGTLNFKPRIIFDHMMVYVLSGRTRWTMHDETVDVEPGHLLFVPPFVPHSSRTGEEAVCEHIAIHFDWKPHFPLNGPSGAKRSPYEVLLPGGLGIPSCQALRCHDSLAALFERIAVLRKSDDSLSCLQSDALLFEALVELIRRVQGERAELVSRCAYANRSRIEEALAFMAAALAEPIELAALADAAGLSSSWFSHVFRLEMGRSPMEQLTAMRIARARELLRDYRLSVKEVAARCGFEDPYYFSKVFSRLDGMSPTQFRETVLRAGSS